MQIPGCRFDEFFAACKDCQFDFLATHLYTCSADALRWYLSDCKRYRLPIWLTEFSCPNGALGPVSQQKAFMASALKVLDEDPAVERYAWFAPRTAGDWLGPSPSLLQPDRPEVSELGKLYITEQNQKASRRPASGLQLWTNMCRICFSPHQASVAIKAARQLCVDCGFGSS